MIEAITTNVVHCDACKRLLENGDGYIHAFQKDICDECVGMLLKKIESDRIITPKEFLELLDDVRYQI